jgi:hypothetical protein
MIGASSDGISRYIASFPNVVEIHPHIIQKSKPICHEVAMLQSEVYHASYTVGIVGASCVRGVWMQKHDVLQPHTDYN